MKKRKINSIELAMMIWNDFIARPNNEGKPINFSFNALNIAIRNKLGEEDEISFPIKYKHTT